MCATEVNSISTTATPQEATLFPLPLDPFEHYMFLDDRREYPMTFVMLYEFDGALDQAILEQAWQHVLQRHPLARSRVEMSSGRPRWVLSDTWPQIDFSTTPLDGRPGTLGSFLDLTQECGVRAAVRQRDGRSCLLIEHHHATNDGVAALQLAGEVMLAYDAVWHQRPIDLPPLDPHRMPKRCQPDATAEPAPKATWQDRWVAAVEAVRFFSRGPSPVAAPQQVTQPVQGFVAPQLLFLPTEFNQQLRSAAGRQGATINDMLLAATFVGLDRWNRDQNDASQRRWLRINMPTNLRERGDAVLPAANAMGFTFITRRRSQLDDRSALLAGVVQETQAIKRHRLGHMFLGTLAAALRHPAAFKWFASRPMCLSTAVLSNVGQLGRRLSPRLPTEGGKIRVGSLILERTGGVPPLRPQTHVAMAVCQYGGGTMLWLRADPRYFDAAATTALLERLNEALEELAGVARGAWKSAVVGSEGITCL